MAVLNRWMGIGYLGSDPEIRMTPSGQKVATFSIACTEKYTDRNGKKVEKVDWINIVAWRKLADIIEQYVKKGSQIYIEGKLTTRSWDDPQSGQKRYKTEIVATQMQMLGGKSDNGYNQDRGQQSYDQGGSSDSYNQDIPDDSDLPFQNERSIMKKCFKCGETKDLSEFYKHKQMADGHLNKCKECTINDAHNHYKKCVKSLDWVEKERKRGRDKYKKYGYRSKSSKGAKEWRERNPEKYKAHLMLNNALKYGKLKKCPCAICKSENSHAHHFDYSKPLDVRWYCPKHHSRIHRYLRYLESKIMYI